MRLFCSSSSAVVFFFLLLIGFHFVIVISGSSKRDNDIHSALVKVAEAMSAPLFGNSNSINLKHYMVAYDVSDGCGPSSKCDRILRSIDRTLTETIINAEMYCDTVQMLGLLLHDQIDPLIALASGPSYDYYNGLNKAEPNKKMMNQKAKDN